MKKVTCKICGEVDLFEHYTDQHYEDPVFPKLYFPTRHSALKAFNDFSEDNYLMSDVSITTLKEFVLHTNPDDDGEGWKKHKTSYDGKAIELWLVSIK